MNKELKVLLKKHCMALENSNKDFKSIYEIMFSNGSRVLTEENKGFRIVKHSYDDIKAMIKKTAAALYQKIGATHSYVGLEMENCTEWIVAFWAILKSGNKPYLINCRHPENLSNTILKNLNIKYIICLQESALQGDSVLFNSLSEIKIDIPDVFENEIAISTSATSLNPVVCFYSGKEISAQILDCKGILNKSDKIAAHYKGSLKQLAFLPFYHIFGLMAVYFWFTFFGRTLVFLKDYSADTILKTIRKHQVTHIFAVPMLWHTIEKQLMKKVRDKGEKTFNKFEKGRKICTSMQNTFPFFGCTVSKKIMREVTNELFGESVQFCISGGSYLRDSAIELFNSLGYPLHNGYGMSEIGITSVELRNKPKHRNENSIGRPFDSVEYKIDDNGILLVNGDSVCKKMMVNGIIKENNGWFNTGDKMHCTNGNYFISGRESDVIIGDNGENINPDMIEQIFTLDDADSFCVLGLGNTENQSVAMVIRINPYLPIDRVEKIINAVYATNDTLPLTSRIKEFYFTYDPLAPETAVKVGRKYLLRAIAEKQVELISFKEIKNRIRTADNEELNSKLADEIRRIIADNLGIDESKVTADSHVITELGGTSIQYFSIITALAEKFEISSYNENDKYCYTLREFCSYIERHI